MCTWYQVEEINEAFTKSPLFEPWFDEHHTITDIYSASIRSVDEWFDDFADIFLSSTTYNRWNELPYSIIRECIDLNQLAEQCSQIEDGGCSFCYDQDRELIFSVDY